ncbi:MAG: radical SAM protein [Candidatus Aminicenantes bacterium]|nr:radical SAM protein [Candidatus Aminicenantes bacterium]
MSHYAIKYLGCNAGCASCYENVIRGCNQQNYDITKMMNTVKSVLYREVKKQRRNKNLKNFKRHFQKPMLHGGEPLLMKTNDIETILSYVFSFFKCSGIQTNLTLLKDEHIDIFKKCKTHVGVSLDGDYPELNRGRFAAGAPLKKIIKDTGKVLENMARLREAGLDMSCIIVLRKYNAACDRLDRLVKFIERLRDEFGIIYFRTNPGIVFDPKLRPIEELTTGELFNAWKRISNIQGVMIQPYRDMVDLLMGSRDTSCNFSECDPWKTSAEIPISGNGEIGNCLKNGAAPDGIQSLTADRRSRQRYQLLEQIPFDQGGCKDCRYWNICYGGCPGAGIDNDFRNRTRFCEAYKLFYEFVEKKIKDLFPNIMLVTDAHPLPIQPGITDILNTITRGTWRQESRVGVNNFKKLLKQKKPKKGSPGTGHTDVGHQNQHGDSNSHKWLNENPWYKGSRR